MMDFLSIKIMIFTLVFYAKVFVFCISNIKWKALFHSLKGNICTLSEYYCFYCDLTFLNV